MVLLDGLLNGFSKIQKKKNFSRACVCACARVHVYIVLLLDYGLDYCVSLLDNN